MPDNAAGKGNSVKKLALAVGIVLAIAVISYVILRSLLVHEDLIGSIYETQAPRAIAALLLGAVTYVHQRVAISKTRPSFTALPRAVVSLEDYSLPWYVMIVYGVCIVYAVSGVGTIIVWAMGETTGIYPTRLIPFLNVPITCLAFFLVSSWIGSRSNTYRFLATLAVVVMYRFVATTIDLLLEPASLLSTIIRISSSTALYLMIALLGLWWGRHVRLLRYLRYLLRLAPAEMRKVIVDKTYEEVRTLAGARTTEDTPGYPDTAHQ